MKNIRYLIIAFIASLVQALGEGSTVNVGEYLYANPEKLPSKPGALVLKFTTPGAERKVIAWGHKYRKDVKERSGTTEEQRQTFKPRLAKLFEDGTVARFWNLPADFYDIIVIDKQSMTVFEGIELMQVAQDEKTALDEAMMETVRKTLCNTDGRLVGGWDAFFEKKQFERGEFSDGRAGVFLQQMRVGKAFAEDNSILKGHVFSIDVLWLEKATINPDAGWQVLNRQQLYRNELGTDKFFKAKYLPQLHAIRVGMREKTIEGIVLE